LRALFDIIESEKNVNKECIESFLKLLNPFCPHLTEELWHEWLGNKDFISLAKWPEYNESKIDNDAEALEILVEDTIYIRNVLTVAKISNPKQLH
jgi:leucyl-tRNA synthetase